MNRESRIHIGFHSLAERGAKALIPFFTFGFPDQETSEALIMAASGAGADFIEIGVPFSDPVADGPSIQRSSQIALEKGANMSGALAMAKGLTGKISTPLIFMTYYNTILSRGLETFANEAAASGVAGLIVPDLPPEEGEPLEEALAGKGIDLIYLASPTSSDERLEVIAGRTRGFVYAVSVIGVTGARDGIGDCLEELVRRIRPHTHLPVCAGFGISGPDSARRASAVADGVIIGSAIVNLIESRPDDPVPAVGQFISEIRTSLGG